MEGKRTMALFRNSFEGKAEEIQKSKKKQHKEMKLGLNQFIKAKTKAKFQMK